MNNGECKEPALCAIDARRRFPDSSYRSLARFLIARHPGMFKNFEHARATVRFTCGVKFNGKGNKVCKAGVPPNDPKKLMPCQRHINRSDYRLPTGTWGILSDLHVPFHEIKPIESAMEWFKDNKITGIILNGDAQDCEGVSYWHSTRRRDFVSEVEDMCDFLDMLRAAFPKVKIVFRRGNHEDRLEDYYRSNAPQLADLVTSDMSAILALKKRKIEWLERKQKITINNFTLLHGHEMRGGYSPVSAARWAILRAKACCAVGHFHATSECTENDINKKMITTWSIGCLCDLEPDYNPYGNKWNWGAAMLYNDGGDNWEFDNRRILMNGKLV